MDKKIGVPMSEYIVNLCKELGIETIDGVVGNELELIALVRNCPVLYDKSYVDFRNVEKKTEVWSAISNAMNTGVGEVQNKWKSMREAFTRYNSNLKKNPNHHPVFPHYEEMKFLLPFITPRRSIPCLKEGEMKINDFLDTDSILLGKEVQEVSKFIKSVKRLPMLYNRRHLNFKDYDLKQKLWNSLSREHKMDISQCIGKWKCLRDRYGRERRKGESTWTFFSDLSFLDTHIVTRRKHPYRSDGSLPSPNVITFSPDPRSFKNRRDSSNDNFNQSYPMSDFDDDEVERLEVKFVDTDNLNEDVHEIVVTKKENNEVGREGDEEDDEEDAEDESNSYSQQNNNKSVMDEDGLFGKTVAAELGRIPPGKRKMKLKADIYKLLYEYSDE